MEAVAFQVLLAAVEGKVEIGGDLVAPIIVAQALGG
jgi:hypothetical protein